MHMIDPILVELEQEAATTRRVPERVPEDRLGWRPHPKSMSLGQLALHVATTPGQVAEIASLDDFEVPSFPQSEAISRKEILDALTASISKAKDLLGKIDDIRAMATWAAQGRQGGDVVLSQGGFA